MVALGCSAWTSDQSLNHGLMTSSSRSKRPASASWTSTLVARCSGCFPSRSERRAGVLTQISAIQAALDKVALGPLDDHARHCVVGGAAAGTPEQRTDEMLAAVGRLLRRG